MADPRLQAVWPQAAPPRWEPHSLSVVGGSGPGGLCTVSGAACVHRAYVCTARSPNGAEAERHREQEGAWGRRQVRQRDPGEALRLPLRMPGLLLGEGCQLTCPLGVLSPVGGSGTVPVSAYLLLCEA